MGKNFPILESEEEIDEELELEEFGEELNCYQKKNSEDPDEFVHF